ncbi:MAG: hypothetical protein ABI986_09125, partial [Chloroflexota bacterium]
MKFKKAFTFMTTLIMLGSMIGVLPAAAGGGTTRLIPSGGTTSLQTGGFTPSGDSDVTQAEFPGQEDEADGPGPYLGTIVNRSLSQGTGSGGPTVTSGKKAKSNPTFNIGFEGLNLYQQRYARGGNQFTLEPP